MVIVVVLADRRTARDAAAALTAGRNDVRAQARRDGLGPPADYDALVSVFNQAARSGQERPESPADAEMWSPPEAMPQLLLTYLDAGRVLGGLSERQVRRLVALGDLPAVTVADRARRIHVDDVTEYAARLRDEAHSPAGPLRQAAPAGATALDQHHHERST